MQIWVVFQRSILGDYSSNNADVFDVHSSRALADAPVIAIAMSHDDRRAAGRSKRTTRNTTNPKSKTRSGYPRLEPEWARDWKVITARFAETPSISSVIIQLPNNRSSNKQLESKLEPEMKAYREAIAIRRAAFDPLTATKKTERQKCTKPYIKHCR
jgi:hypothetical protein